MKKILTLTIALLAVSGAFAAAPALADGGGCPFDQTWGTPSISAAQEIVQLTNEARAKAGLPALHVSSGLTQLAMYRALYMAKFGDFSHDGDSAAVTACGFAPQVGANNGWRFASASAMVTWWMNSSEHRHAILNPAVNYIGAGVANGEHGQMFYEFFSIDDDPSFSDADPYAAVRNWPTSSDRGATADKGFSPQIRQLTVKAGRSATVNVTQSAMTRMGDPIKVKLVKLVQPKIGKAVKVGASSIRFSAPAHSRSSVVPVRFEFRAANGSTGWGVLEVRIIGR